MSFAVFACITGAGTANAQWARQTTFDVGAIRLTRDDFADTDGVNVAGLWSRWNERVSLVASGAATRISDGRSTGIALGSASYMVPLRRFRIEGGATATVLGTTDLSPSSSAVAFGRVHLLGENWGAWAGGGGGNVHLEATTFPAGTGEAGAWLRRGEQRLTLSAVTVGTSTVSSLEFSNGTVFRVRDPVRYADVSLIGHGSWGRLDLDVMGLSRHVSKGSLESIPTASIGAAWWVTPYIAVAAALGRQLADPMRGTVRARYTTVAVRLSAERHGPVVPPRMPPRVPAGEASLVTVTDDAGSTLIRVHAQGAHRVELMGDFTEWEPKPLERRRDRWELRAQVKSGSHHVLVRVDGGKWVVPANLPRLDDELGGTVGLIVIP
jgi:hypothetical protein